MYINITERCNMTCAHCCVRATAKGRDMSLATFRAALRLASELGESYLAIGGGEPTIHPRFWELLGRALESPDVECVWLATNGKRTGTALALAGLSSGVDEGGKLSVALSQDPWHDPIDGRVVSAFKLRELELRDVSKGSGPRNHGRARDNGLAYDSGEHGDCRCPGLTVRVDGTVTACGCEGSAVVGHVNTGVRPDYEEALASDEYRNSGCWFEYVEETEKLVGTDGFDPARLCGRRKPT